MNVCYLILAHHQPRHLGRLVRALATDSSACLVHLDRKSNPSDFVAALAVPNVRTTERRIGIHWGDFSMVEATLVLLREAYADPRQFDVFVLLSGVDYPLQTALYIERFLAAHGGEEFLDMVPMPNDELGKPLSRLTRYKRRPTDSPITSTLRRALVKLGALPRERDYRAGLAGLAPYGGSQWWAMSRDAAGYVLDFVARTPGPVRFFEHTHCPDESFFQTILANSPLRSRIRRNLTYADWTRGGARPSDITEHHLDIFAASDTVVIDDAFGTGEVLFARKFSDENDDLVAKLDRIILARGAGSSPRTGSGS
jgi:hypothetical protein